MLTKDVDTGKEINKAEPSGGFKPRKRKLKINRQDGNGPDSWEGNSTVVTGDNTVNNK